MSSIDNPARNDNRAYDYSGQADEVRAEYPIIVRMVEPGSRVIDYGCGNGALLALLREQKSTDGLGLDISPSGLEACRRKGLTAECRRIDEPHPDLAAGSFDYAICNVTIQMVLYPEVLLREMKRVARKQIVSFANFAFFLNTLDHLWHGRMPKPCLFGYTWYSTGHIHQLSLADFEELLAEVGGLRVLERVGLGDQKAWWGRLARWFPNRFEFIVVYLLEND